jgi:hypothetical protein
MNRALEQAAFIGMRSFTWTVLGPSKEILGGYKALAQGLMNGKVPISMKSDAYDPRIGYAIMFPMTVAMMGSLVNYLMTGEWPKDWKDAFVPRTGGLVPGVGGKGQVEERVRIPGYHKDFIGYWYNPKGELTNKEAGIWQALHEQVSGGRDQWSGTDWRGLPIVPAPDRSSDCRGGGSGNSARGFRRQRGRRC